METTVCEAGMPTMKKTFNLTHPKTEVARLIEAVKSEVRKYLKRERRKKLPHDADFWDFDCRVGLTEESARVVPLKEIESSIDTAERQQNESIYIEILVKPALAVKKVEKVE